MKKLLFAIIALAALSACSSDDEEEKSIKADRTVLVYMSGENSLSNFMNGDLKEMMTGSKQIGDNNLLFYYDAASSKNLPYVARLYQGQIVDSVSIADMGISDTDEYSSDPNVMEKVIRYVFNKYPSKNDDYGLVLWGHASGWLIKDSIANNSSARRKAYGIDNGRNATSDFGKWLNIPSMKNLLSKNKHLTFILADCCNFMCLETAYELRNVTDYLIGSPAEIPGDGAPYHLVVPAMFEQTSFATSIVDKYFEYYWEESTAYSVPLSVIKSSEMEQLAQATRTILNTFLLPDSKEYPDMSGLIHYFAISHMYYDVNDFMLRFASKENYNIWKQAYDRAVIHKRMAKKWMTDPSFDPWNYYFTDFTMTEERFGGVSMFVPQSPFIGDYAKVNFDIGNMGWYYAAGLKDVWSVLCGK